MSLWLGWPCVTRRRHDLASPRALTRLLFSPVEPLRPIRRLFAKSTRLRCGNAKTAPVRPGRLLIYDEIGCGDLLCTRLGTTLPRCRNGPAFASIARLGGYPSE